MSSQVLTVVAYLILLILVINVLLAGLMVFFERRNPASTWAWLLVLFFIPIFGFLSYLIFGKNGKREKMFCEKEVYDQKVYYKYLFHDRHCIEKIQRQKALIESRGRLVEAEYLTDLAYLHLNSGNWMTFNNKVTVFSAGKDKFEALVRDIRKAKKFIHLEYYIWRGDKLGARLVEELVKKAKAGVEVRILYDGMGNSALPKKFFDKLHEVGGYTAAFLPPFIVRLNYRNHRKLCIIDGEIGYIGGFNVGDEYLGIVKRYGPWRDTHLRFEGDAVDQMQIRFVMDWNFTAKNGKVALEDKYFPEREQWDGVETQIVSSGPDTQWKNIRNGYFKMMNEAEDHIYLTTPYFVPDDGIFEALRVAALSGIDVRIIIPGNPDHIFVYWASMSYLGELLEAGVRCYQYEKGFIHAKTLCIDGLVASVGTANMDVRSFDLNFEVNAFMFDAGLTKSLEADFMHDLESSVEITKDWYYRRRRWFKVKEAVARLISPML
ncbi:major cardiolipin synthase ClsA [Anaerotignum neopropionicum]|uniref:Cardiolipin synthase n=1 Tax=Anaerotignum neopropionicum TaxID=36847 RepID=A0A136WC02_9FIRM|nr:cardiolipin synthase [Anaerotignum neopropionicum]KXL52020.1 major cardiolipin synthase ClsA [Anaerotignum neopropionicum]